MAFTNISKHALELNYPAGNLCVMTLHIGHSIAITDVEIDNANIAIRSWYVNGVDGEPSLRQYMANDVTFKRVTGQKLLPGPPGAVRENITAAGGGAGTSGAPPQIAVCISLRTAIAGRRFRGRMYMPGVPEADIGPDGKLTSLVQQGIADSTDGLRRQIDTITTGKLVVFSRVLQSGEEVTNVRVGSTVDTIRRRKVAGETYVTGS